MTINILHLYYDLMNLYGEIGNIKALTHTLRSLNIKVCVDTLSIHDNIDFKKYDFIYIGCGTEDNLDLVKKDIIKYKNQIKEYIDSNKFILSTGSSIELFANNCLDVCNYRVERTEKRLVGDVVVKTDIIKDKIIGFINTSTTIKETDNSKFQVLEGKIENAFVNYKNFYGTLLLGPILARNPSFHKYIVTNLLKNKYPKCKLGTLDFKIDIKAYNRYMNEYHNTNN